MEFSKSLKLVIFDFDGTLFHLGVDWDRVAQEMGIHDTSTKLGDTIERLTLDSDPRLDVLTKYELEAVAGKQLDPAILDALKTLAQNYDIAIYTRNAPEAVRQVITENDFPGLLIIGREPGRHLKPDPEGANVILSHFGYHPEQAVLVGDTYHDMEAAHAAGMASIIVRNPSLAYQPEGASTYIETIPDLIPLLAKT
ncbi:MAG TPA: HAD-IA family hydrolase [Candidatus Saccharimonadales bacterium]|nr:HAD-IA family hydrolase [Candidatus Saccharimonadales bacterium]